MKKIFGMALVVAMASVISACGKSEPATQPAAQAKNDGLMPIPTASNGKNDFASLKVPQGKDTK